MGEFNSVSSCSDQPSSHAAKTEKKRGGLDFREYQELKTGIHRDLISRDGSGEGRDCAR